MDLEESTWWISLSLAETNNGWMVGMGEDIGAMAVEDGAGAQAADHSKEGELSEVKEGCERETAT